MPPIIGKNSNLFIGDHPEATAVWHVADLEFVILPLMSFFIVADPGQCVTTVMIPVRVMAAAALLLPFGVVSDVASIIIAWLCFCLHAPLTLLPPTFGINAPPRSTGLPFVSANVGFRIDFASGRVHQLSAPEVTAHKRPANGEPAPHQMPVARVFT